MPGTAPVLSVVNRVVVVALPGALSAANAPKLRTHLLSLVTDTRPEETVVHLMAVSSIDEAGARPLLEAHRRQRQRHAYLRLGEISVTVADFLQAHALFAETLVPYSGFPSPAPWPARTDVCGPRPTPGPGPDPGA